MHQETEIELLQERIDEMVVSNEEVRNRLAEAQQQISELRNVNDDLQEENRKLSAKIDRLTLHLQQGIEL